MQYFVTGATGFIGSHVVGKLVEQDQDVIALTRNRSNADHLPEPVTVVEGDITDKESMRDAMAGVDGVFHIAGWYELGSGPWQEDRAEQINVEGTRSVLELGKDSTCRRSSIRVPSPSIRIRAANAVMSHTAMMATT